MKLFILITVGALTIGGTACKNRSVNSQGKDVVLVGNEGKMSLLYKADNKIHLKKCENWSIVDNRPACQGTVVQSWNLDTFKLLLVNQLGLPTNYGQNIKTKITIYQSQKSEIPQLIAERKTLEKLVTKIEAFLAYYEGETSTALPHFKTRLAELKSGDKSQAIANYQEIATWINGELEKMVAAVIDEKMTTFQSATAGQGLAFNLLSSLEKQEYKECKEGPRNFGPFQVGAKVLLGRHQDVNGEINWSSSMDRYIGKEASITQLRQKDDRHCEIVRVDIDSGEYYWRISNMTLVSPAP